MDLSRLLDNGLKDFSPHYFNLGLLQENVILHSSSTRLILTHFTCLCGWYHHHWQIYFFDSASHFSTKFQVFPQTAWFTRLFSWNWSQNSFWQVTIIHSVNISEICCRKLVWQKLNLSHPIWLQVANSQKLAQICFLTYSVQICGRCSSMLNHHSTWELFSKQGLSIYGQSLRISLGCSQENPKVFKKNCFTWSSSQTYYPESILPY